MKHAFSQCIYRNSRFRFLFICVFLLLGISPAFALKDTQNNFVIVIPSYNNQEYCERNLNSVFSQSYDHFRVIYVDDDSPDGTGNAVKEYIRKNHLEDRVTLVQNERRIGPLANMYQAIWMCAPDEIVVNLDGDDWFAHRNVLAILDDVYQSGDIWLTYGQFVYYPSYQVGFAEGIPRDIIERNAFRSFTRGTTALRTFYAGLFHQIKKEDLFENGDFFVAGWDLAMMFPMLEMAGTHSRFVPDVSYVYNIDTPINDFKVRGDEQARIDRLLRAKEPYSPIAHYAPPLSLKKVYITPGLWGQLFDIGNPYFNRDNCLDVLYRLRDVAAKRGFSLHQADSLDSLDEFEYLVVFDVFPDQIRELQAFPKEKLVLFLWEPISVIPENFELHYHNIFSKIYTWHDDLVDNKRYFKFYYPVFRPMIDEPVDFYLKRFSTLIACNKFSLHPDELYNARLNVIDFFEDLRSDDFELYGRRWPDYLRVYQGPVDKKVDYLKYYKFSYAYENIKNVPGYVTEKIFDCFQAGAVPIYWGAPNVFEYIPRNCFIHREDFANEADLYAFLKSMSASQYQTYLDNIQNFLKSDAAHLYSIEHFIDIFMDLLTSPK